MDRLPINLDPFAGVPLYRQLSEALRYRISSGALPSGFRLPTLREGAELWEVNLHTVRRAYLDLRDSGLVDVARPLGTFVAPGGRTVASRSMNDWVRTVVADAEERFGLTPSELVEVIQGAGERAPSIVHVVECSHTLSESLARQMRQRWGVDVRPVHLADLADLGPGRVVGTYFHFNEIRAALSHRMRDVSFVSIAPDADELKRIEGEVRGLAATVLTLCETDPLMGQSVLADVAALIGNTSLELRVRVTQDPAAALFDGTPVLFSPGAWDQLTDEQRGLAHSFLLTYRVAEADLVERPILGT